MPDPTAKQLRLLRALAAERGKTFAVPRTRAQASREIARIKAPPVDQCVAAVDRREVSQELACAGDAATPRSHEIVGYGANCRWSHLVHDE
jgi:hypothetical protein